MSTFLITKGSLRWSSYNLNFFAKRNTFSEAEHIRSVTIPSYDIQFISPTGLAVLFGEVSFKYPTGQKHVQLWIFQNNRSDPLSAPFCSHNADPLTPGL